MKAADVGFWDRLMREGRISQTLPLTRGSEVSGTVAALGAGIEAFALGDARYGATNDQFVGGKPSARWSRPADRVQARRARLH